MFTAPHRRENRVTVYHSRLIKIIAGKHLSYKKVFPTVVQRQLGINNL
jgi:hypothetical protein